MATGVRFDLCPCFINGEISKIVDVSLSRFFCHGLRPHSLREIMYGSGTAFPVTGLLKSRLVLLPLLSILAKGLKYVTDLNQLDYFLGANS